MTDCRCCVDKHDGPAKSGWPFAGERVIFPAPLSDCPVTPPSLQRVGQRGVGQEPAPADEGAGPMLLRPFHLLRHPPLPRGESVGPPSREGAEVTRVRECVRAEWHEV